MKKHILTAIISIAASLATVFICAGMFPYLRVHGQSTFVTTPPGAGIPFYNASGTLIGTGACMFDSATSASSTGLWSLNYSAVGFTSVRSVQVQATSTASTAAGTVNGGMTAPSTSSVAGITTVPSGSVLGLIPLTANPTSAVVYVTVCGLK